ncbi:arginine--tRNA ligase [Candidatus Riesia pediculicola]|uniref:Arginine--tRNA ligase n=1 Tax=Riesia pediculicola (strain USDA) TaxID=515618 RepID=D4G8A3_RIEPU|nr:arginine--tRNA ligase [Candidatus Riesia pediculicola]ADD79786.1 arginyl-tRNA synthetase [Candidatus Riesia pediculicola USDA]ARC53797.1 arginine--tRNA ligase [Candidatus Riesia pediculicola]QOJ86432.1 arginine--tRNA ligase [Candidatus Riesia pediculicola]
MNIKREIQEKIQNTINFHSLSNGKDIQVRFSNHSNKFGNYQVDGLSNMLRSNRISLKEFGKKLLLELSKQEYFKKIEIIEPNFINVFLEEKWINQQIDCMLSEKYLSTIRSENTEKNMVTIIDYSSPNIAKNMHVGHLRSTIIGDSIVRISKFLGKKIIKVNHIGDWGTHFGMLIAYLKEILRKNSTQNITLEKLEEFYQESRKIFDQDKEFSKISRRYIQKLQSGNSELLELWKNLVHITISENQRIYKLLGVSLKKKDIVAESFYKSMLEEIVEDLKHRKIAVVDKGAVVVYLEEFKNKYGKPSAVMIQKSDGGYLYTTTEIACLKYRCQKLKADRILYYVDSRQKRHLQQSWIIAKKAGYVEENVKLEHHQIGMILGKDKKPFRTRSGKNVKLFEILEKSIIKAKQFISEKGLKNSRKRNILKIARKIGIGSVKYSDLSKNRKTDYIFNWSTIFSFIGNTASYIQYTYSRANSLIKKSKMNLNEIKDETFIATNSYEKIISMHLLRFVEILQETSQKGLPNILCNYLYRLSNEFSKFYENCSIINVQDKTRKKNRLKLVYLTKITIKIGLNLLGIQTISKM